MWICLAALNALAPSYNDKVQQPNNAAIDCHSQTCIAFTKQASPLTLKHLNCSKSGSTPKKRKTLSLPSPEASDIHKGNLSLHLMPLHLTNSPSIMTLLAFSMRSCTKPHLIAFLSLGSELISRPLVPGYKTTSVFQALPVIIAIDGDITSLIAPVHPWLLWE